MKKIIAVPLIVMVFAALYFSGLNKTVETIVLKNTPGYCDKEINITLNGYNVFLIPHLSKKGFCPDFTKKCIGLTSHENGELKIYIDPCQRNMYYVKRTCEHEFCHVLMYEAGYPLDMKQQKICEKMEEYIFMFKECENIIKIIYDEMW